MLPMKRYSSLNGKRVVRRGSPAPRPVFTKTVPGFIRPRAAREPLPDTRDPAPIKRTPVGSVRIRGICGIFAGQGVSGSDTFHGSRAGAHE
jgi:hypothetical protein